VPIFTERGGKIKRKKNGGRKDAALRAVLLKGDIEGNRGGGEMGRTLPRTGNRAPGERGQLEVGKRFSAGKEKN